MQQSPLVHELEENKPPLGPPAAVIKHNSTFTGSKRPSTDATQNRTKLVFQGSKEHQNQQTMNRTPRDIAATSSRNRREVFLLDAQNSQERIKIQTRIRPVTKSNDLSTAVSQKMIADSQQAATNISQDKPLSHAARHLRSS